MQSSASEANVQMTQHGRYPTRTADTNLPEFALVLPRTRPRQFKHGGKEKREWLLRLPKGVEEYSWGADGEDGPLYGRSVKSQYCTSHLVC